ncbi:ROK family transcriptional regulator [Nesterenkonia sp. LB17]|uniref:ROK family transcriptional regulator n=1 Tax=unclassified Nesterenkonia TaxID=2629769 RepID=UPI001F4CE607|nr:MULTISPECIES: ROK family protein [unclassified Nesterenkonia]MCH8560955.1 ROK family transcriptional regulator [Nesterenkonia sp. DZ6]MCH8563435.1 ROK family transcriptional regulator [Nesterenkonia sp. YGD6]MCH8566085.1 ROK family transcriptional regulator [Nesterenkonia sp. LB17]MCH8571035.1 ROK family transcriptional regulator [Nesterenkonia sp. AY15]
MASFSVIDEQNSVAFAPAGNTLPNSAGALFQLLRDGTPRTRSDLTAMTGFARSTISARVEELLDASLIRPAGENSSTGGRPPSTFAFNPDARSVLAVDLGGTHARIAVTDLAARVLAEKEQELDITRGPVAVLDAVGAIAMELLQETGRSPEDLLGVGVGVPGPVEFATGRPMSPPIMPGWDHFDIPGHLRQWFPVPIMVDNDVNAMALGEHAVTYPGVANMMFVKVATGIGSGIISDGRLQHGAQGAAGDLGHIAIPDGDTTPCTCGNAGCLEAVASGPAIAAQLRERGFDVPHHAAMLDLVRSGDVEALRTVRQAGRQVGSVLAGCVNLLNPSVIVIGGVVSTAGEHFLAGIREAVYSRSLPLATQHLRIVVTQTRARAGVLGASALVTGHGLSVENVNRLVG